MSRYIDADALIEYLKKMWGRWDEDDWYEAQSKDAMKDDIEIVNKQPTVDAVPVVRCKECKNLGNNDGYYFCNAIGLAFGDKPNWFCADGERRNDGTTAD